MEKMRPIRIKTLPETLGAYGDGGGARFHMPGHKGRGLDSFIHGDIGRWDITELSFSDNLHAPSGPLALTQSRMATAYGAARSFLVVGGSTAAIQAMLLSLSPADRLLISRDCHKSAVGGAILSGLDCHFLFPPYDETLDLFGLPTPEALEAALRQTEATAVYVTSPNYYGYCADLPGLSKICRAYGALLIVDAAHGAHFPFSAALPEGCAPYADLFCHSQHKTMNALTQAASLHVNCCRVSPERVQRMLSILQTSSPSYLLMASLDYAVYSGPRQDWSGLVRRLKGLEKEIARLPGLRPLSGTLPLGAVDRDATKLVIDVSGRGITGFQAQAALERMDVFIEMADARRLILITSPEDDPRWYDMLLFALEKLPYGRQTRFTRSFCFTPPLRRMDMRTAALADTEAVALERAANRVLSEALGLYPPGIALCLPGEELSNETLSLLLKARREGATLFGLRGETVETVVQT